MTSTTNPAIATTPATPPTPQAPPTLQRIRDLPDWETPSKPPKRPKFSYTKLSRSFRRSRLGTLLFPPKPRPRSVFPSHDSLEQGLEKGATVHRTSFNIPTPPSYRPRKILGLTRDVFILALILSALFLVALALGLGLGLGLTHHAPELPLPDTEGRVYEGDLTYFKPGLGACGWTNNITDPICAVGHELFDAVRNGTNPNGNPLCGRKIRVMRDFSESGRGEVAVEVVVVDRCEGCGMMDLDLAPGVFDMLAVESKGRVVGRWMWL
ncbi:hypothetical protein OQA88_3286 [Cercophora sp. LCS_1]